MKKRDEPLLRSNITKRGGPDNSSETPEDKPVKEKIRKKFNLSENAKILME